MNSTAQNNQPNHDPIIIEEIIKCGDIAQLEEFVAQGYDFNQIDEDYLTPLMAQDMMVLAKKLS